MKQPDALRPQAGPAVWERADLAEMSWSLSLTKVQQQALVTATRRAIEFGDTEDTLRREGFHIPKLEPILRALQHDLVYGRGFVLVRGFPVDLLDPEEIAVTYVGLGAHLGNSVGQGRTGVLLTRISDEHLPPGTTNIRRYKARQAMDFHTDSVDTVGLLCIRAGSSGGVSRLVSSGAVYNRMLAVRSDLVAALYDPLCWDRHNDELDDSQRWDVCAPITIVDGALRIDYIGWDIRDAQRFPGVPTITGAQMDAMDLLDATMRDRNLQIEMSFEPGDLQLINDRVVLHARDAFEDPPPPALGRLLLRLWLEGPRQTVTDDEHRPDHRA